MKIPDPNLHPPLLCLFSRAGPSFVSALRFRVPAAAPPIGDAGNSSILQGVGAYHVNYLAFRHHAIPQTPLPQAIFPSPVAKQNPFKLRVPPRV